MYDINTKNVKKGKSFYLIFLIVGILFLLIFALVFISVINKKNSLDSQVESSSVEIYSSIDDDGTTMYSSTYTYFVNGDPYTCSSSVSTSSYPSGKNKTVYYDSKNPAKCMTDDSSFNLIYLVFLVLPVIFIILGGVGIHQINKRVKLIDDLNSKGKLVKGLKYRMEDSNIEVNGVRLQRPVVDYVLSSGSSITLYGDTRHDKKMSDEDGLVDLVIDESNPSNYFIDFEINRLSGNLPTDFYDQTNYTQSNIIDEKNIDATGIRQYGNTIIHDNTGTDVSQNNLN